MTDRTIIPIFIPNLGCPGRCVFCDQRRTTGSARRTPSPEEIGAEIEKWLAQRIRKNRGIVQVAFYGGTFTALPLQRQRELLEATRPFLKSHLVDSLRISTRPDTITPEVLEILARGGVRTVELGVQSLDPEVLRLSGRDYGPEEVKRASQLIKERGFELGIQIMVGLPGDTAERFMETVKGVIDLGPDFARIYPTLVIRGTVLEEWFHSGKYRPLDLPEAIELSKRATLALEGAGIRVIRIGLQPTRELQQSLVAGPYHPAFGQMVRGEILLQRAREALKGVKGQVTLLINPRDIDLLYGHGRRNWEKLRGEFPKVGISVAADPKIKRWNVGIEVV